MIEVDGLGLSVLVSPSFQNNTCLMGRLWSEPRVVGRFGSGVQASTSFQIFALTAVEMSKVGEENCPGELSGRGNVLPSVAVGPVNGREADNDRC